MHPHQAALARSEELKELGQADDGAEHALTRRTQHRLMGRSCSYARFQYLKSFGGLLVDRRHAARKTSACSFTKIRALFLAAAWKPREITFMQSIVAGCLGIAGKAGTRRTARGYRHREGSHLFVHHADRRSQRSEVPCLCHTRNRAGNGHSSSMRATGGPLCADFLRSQ